MEREEAREIAWSCMKRHSGFSEAMREVVMSAGAQLRACTECIAGSLAAQSAALEVVLSVPDDDDPGVVALRDRVRALAARPTPASRVETLRAALERLLREYDEANDYSITNEALAEARAALATSTPAPDAT